VEQKVEVEVLLSERNSYHQITIKTNANKQTILKAPFGRGTMKRKKV
jgi:hypothetical protein